MVGKSLRTRRDFNEEARHPAGTSDQRNPGGIRNQGLRRPRGRHREIPQCNGGYPDFDTPLGDTLPASIDPETAAGLASNLRAALPRIRELLGLLTRAARKTAKPTHPALGASPRETGALFDRTAANLRHGKGGKQRVVPITDTADDDEIRAAMTVAVAG